MKFCIFILLEYGQKSKDSVFYYKKKFTASFLKCKRLLAKQTDKNTTKKTFLLKWYFLPLITIVNFSCVMMLYFSMVCEIHYSISYRLKIFLTKRSWKKIQKKLGKGYWSQSLKKDQKILSWLINLQIFYLFKSSWKARNDMKNIRKTKNENYQYRAKSGIHIT